MRHLLEELVAGRRSLEDTERALTRGFEEVEGARLDHDRARRHGYPEVIYGPGKSKDELISLCSVSLEGHGRVLATRLEPETAQEVLEAFDRGASSRLRYDLRARVLYSLPEPHAGLGRVGIVSAGSSDQSVAREAEISARYMGLEVDCVTDVGVAGIHRLLDRSTMSRIRECRVLIVVAGMEGALPSVVGGICGQPLIAVPTSVGYGANLGGLSALLGMLNSCASGITVVNIDNGFGAAAAAFRILGRG